VALRPPGNSLTIPTSSVVQQASASNVPMVASSPSPSLSPIPPSTPTPLPISSEPKNPTDSNPSLGIEPSTQSSSAYSRVGGGSDSTTPSGAVNLPLEITGVLTKDGLPTLHPDYLGEAIELTLVGHFPDLTNVNELELILDNAIPLRVTSVSENKVTAFLSQKRVPDLYLAGTHKLEARLNKQTTRFQLEIGSPQKPYAISPKIDFVDIEYSSESQPVALKLQGNDLLLNPFFAQIKLDDTILNILSTEILPEFTVVRVALPNTFDIKSDYSLIYTSPFGSTTHLIRGE
jgi:hypothetical protein